MTVSYRVLIRLLLPLVFVYLWLRGRKAPAYRRRWGERLALQSIPVQARDGIIIHCVSVGETIAAKSLIELLLQRYPHLPITLTSMTPTAAAIAEKLFGQQVFHYYLPLDTPGAMRRFLSQLTPRLILLLETEIWPCLLRQAANQRIPVAVVNARMSERSLSSYRKYAWLVGPVWRHITWLAAQTKASQERFVALGCEADKVAVRGNLKHDFQVSPELSEQAKVWRDQLKRPIVLAASTHEGEDEQVLEAFRLLLHDFPQALLILVPRHPERFDAVATQILKNGFNLVRRTDGDRVTAVHQVFLGDSMGELLLWYSIADVAWVGGSLIERGGHNPLEPVATKTPVLSGPHVFNFQEIYDRLQQADAVKMIHDANELARAWKKVLEDSQYRQRLVHNATDVFAQDQGATAAIFEDLAAMLKNNSGGEIARTFKMIATEQPDKDTTIWFDPQLAENCSDAWFEPAHWQNLNKIKGSATGRNTAWFIDAGNTGLLLRHYYRGGLVGKLNKDRFKREAIAASRAMAEFALLLKLRELQLPVPRPAAARYQRASGWGYRADILVEVIPNAQDVYKLLGQRSLEDSEWQALGQAVRLLHQHGVFHSDLNCHNLMLDAQGKAWVVDFDKCEMREQSSDWQQANLQRLLRSLRKEHGKAEAANQPFHWREAVDWPKLIDAYSRI